MKRTVAIVCMALSALLMGGWGAMWMQVPEDARSLWTQDKYEQKTKEKDEFGDEVEKSVWIEQWTPGLLDMVLPADAVLTTAAIALLVLQMRQEKATRKPS